MGRVLLHGFTGLDPEQCALILTGGDIEQPVRGVECKALQSAGAADAMAPVS